MSESWLDYYRDTIKRKLFWLKLRYRLLLFIEAALLCAAVVLLASAAIVAVGKAVFLPEPLRSLRTLLIVLEIVVFGSFLWAMLRPVHDLKLAAFVDREISRPGLIESAVDFLSRPNEIDPLHFRLFLQSVADVLTSTPNKQIISLRVPKLWRAAALALALLLAVHFFVPVTRVVTEDQDPFLIRDLQRLSVQFAGAVLNTSREENLSQEDKELFEKAEQLSRRMAADAIDPNYLQDELLKLTKQINERSAHSREASDQLLEKLLQEIERFRRDRAGSGADNSALEAAIGLLAATAQKMQDSSLQQQVREIQEMSEIVQGLLETPTGEELEVIQNLISELQSELKRSAALQNLSDLSERALRSLNRDHLGDLTSKRRDQLSEQMREFLRSYAGTQSKSGTLSSQNADGREQETGYLLNGAADQSFLGGQDDSTGSGVGAAAGEDDRSGSMGVPADGIGTSPGDNLFGPMSEQAEGFRTLVDHRLISEDEEMDLTLSTVLGSPAEGQVKMQPPDRLAVYSGETYEGQILEGGFPERYKQIVSNYFDSLK